MTPPSSTEGVTPSGLRDMTGEFQRCEQRHDFGTSHWHPLRSRRVATQPTTPDESRHADAFADALHEIAATYPTPTSDTDLRAAIYKWVNRAWSSGPWSADYIEGYEAAVTEIRAILEGTTQTGGGGSDLPQPALDVERLERAISRADINSETMSVSEMAQDIAAEYATQTGAARECVSCFDGEHDEDSHDHHRHGDRGDPYIGPDHSQEVTERE